MTLQRAGSMWPKIWLFILNVVLRDIKASWCMKKMAPPLPACIALWWHFRLLCSPTFRTCCLHYGQSRCLVHGPADLTRNVSDSWKRWFLQKTLNNTSVIFYFYSYYTTEAMICFCFFSFFWLTSIQKSGWQQPKRATTDFLLPTNTFQLPLEAPKLFPGHKMHNLSLRFLVYPSGSS